MLRHRSLNPTSSASTDKTELINKEMEEKKVFKRKCSKYSCCKVLSIVVLFLFLVLYVIFPIAFKTCDSISNGMLFMNNLNFQFYMNVSNPQEYGLNCTKSFFIPTKNGIQLGAWHIYPSSKLSDCYKSQLPEGSFDDDRPVFIYFHGNGGTRGGFHRLELYKLLAYSQLDSHVLAIDYRGFADSYPPVSPNIPGAVDDAISAYEWLMKRVSPNRTVLWTHSLGTFLGLNVINKVDENIRPKHLVLEAPFSSLPEAVTYYPLSKIYAYYPLFNYFIVNSIVEARSNVTDSDLNIQSAQVPILILHAEDDGIVPVFLGEKLYKYALSNENSFSAENTELILFKGNLGYGHRHICRDPNLIYIIGEKVLKLNKLL